MKKTYTILLACVLANTIAYAQEVDFDEFLNDFYLVNNVTYEKPRYFAEIKEGLVKKFLPLPLPICSKEKANDWRAASKWETDGMNVVFAERHINAPCDEEGCPWREGWLASYDNSGNLIDYILAVKSGDRYVHEIKGTLSPMRITVEFAAISKETMRNKHSDAKAIPCVVEFFDVFMDSNGHFHKTKNRMDAKGQLVWNKEKQKYDIKVAE